MSTVIAASKAKTHPLVRRALNILGPLGIDLADHWACLRPDGAITVFTDTPHVIIDGPALLHDMRDRLELFCDFAVPALYGNSAGAPISRCGLLNCGDAILLFFEDDDDQEFSRLSIDFYPQGGGANPKLWLRDALQAALAADLGRIGGLLQHYSGVIGHDWLSGVIDKTLLCRGEPAATHDLSTPARKL